MTFHLTYEVTHQLINSKHTYIETLYLQIPCFSTVTENLKYYTLVLHISLTPQTVSAVKTKLIIIIYLNALFTITYV